MTRHLLLGGARSGKSSHAQDLALHSGLPVTMVVTAEPFDEELRERIARHRRDRPSHWTVIEAPLDLVGALDGLGAGHCVIVDCLTLWLNNRLHHHPQVSPHAAVEELCAALRRCPAELILVSNEVGMGVLPMGEITRRFVDHAGWMNQAVARCCDRVTLVCAGLPLRLKS